MIKEQRLEKIEYTSDQEKALEEVSKFLHLPSNYNVEYNTFRLAGYAGTGKTTIIENIFTYARDVMGLDVYIVAPTNAAVKVLRQKSENWKADCIDYDTKFRTLHSLLFGEPDKDGNWHPKCNFNKGQVVIIDESSMIDTFLNDSINKQIAIRGAKVIKIGDGFQLEPVNDDPKVLNNPSVEMKDVRRHDGVILDYVTKLREIKTSCIPTESLRELDILPIANVGEKWLEDVKENEDCVFVVAKNNTRVALNKLARSHKFGEDPEILKETDQMIVIANSPDYKNSETFHVEKVIDIKPIEIFSRDGESFGDCYYAEILIIGGSRNHILMFPNTIRPSIYHPEIDTRNFPVELEHLVQYRNYKPPVLKRTVLITTYGYAITAHKAQGSQWENVYVHNDFWGDNPRWLYTAASRAIKNLTMSDESSKKKIEWEQINGKV